MSRQIDIDQCHVGLTLTVIFGGLRAPRTEGVVGPPRVDVVVHFNTIEGVFTVFKRGMVGVYQHCDKQHLHRDLAEFDFRYNRRTTMKVTNTERHDQLLAMIEGKHLTYRRIGEGDHA